MLLGDQFHSTYLITSKIVNTFRKIFNDNNSLHIDTEYAIKNGFQSKVVYGNILNGFISNFVGEVLPINNVILQKQTILYYNPVYLGDTLSFNALVIGVYESVNSIEFKYRFENQNGNKIATGKIQIGILL